MAVTHFKGQDVELSGIELNVGDMAPVVKLINSELKEVEVGGKKDKSQLLIVVPSLDTDTCRAETKRFNQEVAMLDMADIFVISQDLPFAQKKFCVSEGIDNLMILSDYIDKEFGKNYGVLMANSPLKGLLCRAIFIVNEYGVVSYKEIVPEVTEEPNYERILEAIKDTRV
ncbi:MAG: thiol peroxidase [Campylobacterales bacterium]|nr:thiol peroxidase [Campylobacterales bacterium]